MADNVQVSQGIGTTMSTNEIAGVQYPRQKIGWGEPGTFNDTSAAAPLPVQVVGSSSNVITGCFSGFDSLNFNETVALFSITPLAAITTKFLTVGGTSDGVFELFIGAVSYGRFRICWNTRTFGLPLGQIQVASGTPITLTVTCQSESGGPGDYEGYVYY